MKPDPPTKPPPRPPAYHCRWCGAAVKVKLPECCVCGRKLAPVTTRTILRGK